MIVISINRPGGLPPLRVTLPHNEALRIRDALTEQLNNAIPNMLRKDAPQVEISFLKGLPQ